MSQTGGGCRASNYIGFIRRALEKAGMAQIPVISINANGMETNPGFKYTPSMLVKALQAVVYGDVFMRVLYATRPLRGRSRLRKRSPREVEEDLCQSTLHKERRNDDLREEYPRHHPRLR